MLRSLLALPIVIASFAPAAAETPSVTTSPVPLSAADPALERVGKLTFRGGLELESADPRFGGWSDLIAEEGGAAFLAIGDQASWMRAALEWDAEGRLSGLALTAFGPLLDEAGRPLAEKALSDAESLAPAAAGGWLVGFERAHRIWR